MSLYHAPKDGKILVEYETVIIKDGCGKDTEVRKLTNEEAKAYISGELGFEYNTIRIEGDCWYEATDWNFFKFSVKGRQYEYENFCNLKIFDTEGGNL